MNIDPEKRIETIIGRPLASDEKGIYQSLSDIPESLIADARRLSSSILRYVFLRHYVDDSLIHDLPVFIEDVVDGNQSAATWRKGRILIPEFPIGILVGLNIENILVVLQPESDEDWQRLIPDRLSWEKRDLLTGAPALIRPHIGHNWKPPQYVISFGMDGSDPLEPIQDITIATRRWIASNIAFFAWHNGLLGIVNDPYQLISRAIADTVSISSDALIAARALVLEEQELTRKDQKIPGFRGPDDWYMG